MSSSFVDAALCDVPPKTREIFVMYHKENLAVWREFERVALQMCKRRKAYGAKAIFERVRWEVEIEKGGEFKANNNFAAYYARIFVAKYPMFRALFAFREIKGLGHEI